MVTHAVSLQLDADALTFSADTDLDPVVEPALVLANAHARLTRSVTPAALELAIAEIEDAIMPVLKRMPTSKRIVLRGDGWSTLAHFFPDHGKSGLALNDVEQLFNDLADHASGMTHAWQSDTAAESVAWPLTVLREVMHHGAFVLARPESPIITAEGTPMSHHEITEIKRAFLSRLDALSHLLDVAEGHFTDMASVMQARLVPDMLPLGAQIAFACNQPRGFSQWCAGEPIDNLSVDVESLALARSHIADTKALVSGIQATDAKLDEVKRIGLGPGKYCELPARQYISEYLVPNLYFHITTTYAILRSLGAPLGKADYLCYLAPHVKLDAA